MKHYDDMTREEKLNFLRSMIGCKSDREILLMLLDLLAAGEAQPEICDACNGSGEGVADTVCGECNGTGGMQP